MPHVDLFESGHDRNGLNAPLFQLRVPDCPIWVDLVVRQLLVKSAYYVAWKVLGKDDLLSHHRLCCWRMVWIANLLPKIKLFAWRLMNGILPTTIALRGIGLML